MTTRVTVVDLGLGNLHSVHQALLRVGAEPTITRDPSAVRDASRLVVPGQGAFREGSEALVGPLGDALRDYLGSERPYLGICLGMQLLFERSEEAPGHAGLGVLEGEVRRFAHDLRDSEGARLKVPHMTWSPITLARPTPLLDEGGWYYFVHSFCCVPTDPALTVATADYGGDFCAAVQRGPLFACQFHPEKSQRRGAKLLEAFLRWS
ncbi:MAG: imidazole glycerol phosphate synthase subunit HisH [Polyangiales bacterium]